MDIKNSVPMRLLAAEKIKHPYFFKRVEQLVRDKEAAWISHTAIARYG